MYQYHHWTLDIGIQYNYQALELFHSPNKTCSHSFENRFSFSLTSDLKSHSLTWYQATLSLHLLKFSSLLENFDNHAAWYFHHHMITYNHTHNWTCSKCKKQNEAKQKLASHSAQWQNCHPFPLHNFSPRKELLEINYALFIQFWNDDVLVLQRMPEWQSSQWLSMYVYKHACLNITSPSILHLTLSKVKPYLYKPSKVKQAWWYWFAISKLLTLTLKACTVLSRRRMLQTTSVCCLSRASSDARTL